MLCEEKIPITRGSRVSSRMVRSSSNAIVPGSPLLLKSFARLSLSSSLAPFRRVRLGCPV